MLPFFLPSPGTSVCVCFLSPPFLLISLDDFEATVLEVFVEHSYRQQQVEYKRILHLHKLIELSPLFMAT